MLARFFVEGDCVWGYRVVSEFQKWPKRVGKALISLNLPSLALTQAQKHTYT